MGVTRGDPVDLEVLAAVEAVDIRLHARFQQGVVERRREGAAVFLPAPGNTHLPHLLPPDLAGPVANLAESEAGAFAQVLPRLGDADEGDPDPHPDRARTRGVEADEGPGLGGGARVAGNERWPARDRLVVEGIGRFVAGLLRPGRKGRALPGAVPLERTVEPGREIDLVFRRLPAEPTALRGSGHLTGFRIDLHRGEVVGHRAATRVQGQGPSVRLREGEAAHRGAGGCGQFRADLVGLAGVEDHAVETGPGLFVAMAEGRDDRRVDVGGTGDDG